MHAIGSRITRLLGGGGLRVASASNFVAYVLAVLASLATFRAMIALTDTPTAGLWAMILGFATAVGVTEMGLGTNLTRFVAGRRDVSQRLLARLAAVGAIMCLFPAVLFSLLAAWPIYRFAVTRHDLPVDAETVVIMTVAALGATFVNAVIAISSGLAEGLGRVSQRSASLLVYNAVTLGTIWPAVHLFGAAGIGLANIIGVITQLALVLAILFLAARKLPRATDEETVGALLQTLFPSTMQMLGIVLTRLTLEPVARFFVASAGTLTVQAWFELALRVTNQVRQVVHMSLRPLLYVGASDQGSLTERFERPRQFTVRISAVLFLALMCGSPVISAVILGRIEAGFIVLLLILGLGGAFAVNGLPGYFALAACNRFGAILKITLWITAINAVLGGLVVLLGGGQIEATAALAVALAFGGIALMQSHARMAGQAFRTQFGGFWPGCVAGVAVGGGLALAADRFAPLTVVVLAAVAALLLVMPAWTLTRMFLRKSA